jgi:hypothetical protein
MARIARRQPNIGMKIGDYDRQGDTPIVSLGKTHDLTGW